jgi:glucose/arabinose dehydrogenase
MRTKGGLILLVSLAALGGVALVQRGESPSASQGGDPAVGDVPAGTAPPVGGTSPTAPVATAPIETTPPPPVTPISALPKPSSAGFGSVGLRTETALDIPDLTGMVWNQSAGAYFAITQTGQVYRIGHQLLGAELVLDVSAESTVIETGSERGLLGIAFDPRDGRMFLYFTDRDNDTRVISLAMNGNAPDPGQRREVLLVDQPGLGHKAGDMQFDANGNLFIALGDGGGSNGRDAQDPTKLLGKILRVTPRMDGDGYDIPADNPFVAGGGMPPEAWVVGLRNPWQFRIDETTGDMYIGDVGESEIEELDLVPFGTNRQNFGWFWFEGTHDRNSSDPKPPEVEITPPIYEYDHTVGPAVIGGQIYYGSAIPALRGAYVFGDMTGPMFALGSDGTTRLNLNAPGVVTSFVETPDRELLLTTLREGILRLLPA